MQSRFLCVFLFLLHSTQPKPVSPQLLEKALSHPSCATLPLKEPEPTQPFTCIQSPGRLKITCLTIGTRGDVEPYLALCKGLNKEGHLCTIATHIEFKNWIESYGIKFANIGGSPVDLIKHATENGILTYKFWKKGITKFKDWYQEMLQMSYEALKDQDLLIASPMAFVGTHVSEALKIPYYQAFYVQCTRTSRYPHGFTPQAGSRIPFYNSFSYKFFELATWLGLKDNINNWRKKNGLQEISFSALRKREYPFLYSLSTSVVERPKNWGALVKMTGYWFLNDKPESILNKQSEADTLKGLEDFIKKARNAGKKIVYIGFGSIVVDNPTEMTKTIARAVGDADVYAVVSAGWSARASKTSNNISTEEAVDQEQFFTDKMFHVKSVPHHWLFPKIDAAVHHGGAGTTGASLRAGIPTIIKPFFGDQYFWATRVKKLGVGSVLKKLDSNRLSRALQRATQDLRQIARAKEIGKKIREEDGVHNAIEFIYQEYSKTKQMSQQRPQDTDTLVNKPAQKEVWFKKMLNSICIPNHF